MASRFQLQAQEGQRKANNPAHYCSHPRCLWRIADRNGERMAEYPDGRCPRHPLPEPPTRPEGAEADPPQDRLDPWLYERGAP